MSTNNEKMIKVNGCTQFIYEDNNHKNFKMATELFELFDDLIVNLDSTIEKLKQFPKDFNICFYVANIHECTCNAFQLACVFGNKKLIMALINDNINYLNDKFIFGTCICTTPLEILLSDGHYNVVKSFSSNSLIHVY